VRLDALEDDTGAALGGGAGADDSDDEFQLGTDADGRLVEAGREGGDGRKRARVTGGQRATRTQLQARAAKTFAALLEEADLEGHPGPTWLSAAARPALAQAPRCFCGICGHAAGYACPRCGARYCGRACAATHTETRCLKNVS